MSDAQNKSMSWGDFVTYCVPKKRFLKIGDTIVFANGHRDTIQVIYNSCTEANVQGMRTVYKFRFLGPVQYVSLLALDDIRWRTVGLPSEVVFSDRTPTEYPFTQKESVIAEGKRDDPEIVALLAEHERGRDAMAKAIESLKATPEGKAFAEEKQRESDKRQKLLSDVRYELLRVGFTNAQTQTLIDVGISLANMEFKKATT